VRVTIGKHTIPLGLIGAILSILFSGAFAAYLLTVSIPLTVQEPIEILGHPEALDLYPGETIDFNTTLQNHASLDYALFLNFYLDNTTYQQSYVTTSNETYIVHPGVQNLSSWLKVSANATPRSSVLTVSFHREAIEDYAQESLWIGDINFGIGAGDGWITFTVLNTGTVAVTIKEFRVNNQKVNTTSPALPTTVSASSNMFAELSGLTIVSGHSYEVTCLTSKGNLFSKSAVAPQPWGVFLYKANVNFYSVGAVKKIDIDIGNSGNTDTNITVAYIGTSASTLQKQTITSVLVRAGASDPATITVTYDWAAGSTYYFKVISSSGQSLDWPEQAPNT